MKLMTLENWTHGQYVKEEIRAIVSCGASASTELEYYLTVLDENDAEIFQQGFKQLEKAIEVINMRYADIWDLVDTNEPEKEGGCSSCVAH